LSELKKLILKAKKKDEKAMEMLFIKFRPLLISMARGYVKYGLEYEDVFQQGALIFILAVYDYKEQPPVTFAGYIKKRLKWGLWAYGRKHLKKQREISCGLKIKGERH